MPTTGSDFYKQFANSIEQPYSGYMDEIKATRLAKDALVRICELKYSGLNTEKQYDELSNLILLDEPRFVRNNRVRTSPIPLSNVTTAGVITTQVDHQLQVGDSVTLSNLSGFTPSVNGTYTVVTVPSSTSITVTFPVVTGLWTAGTGSITHQFMYADMLHPFSMKVNMVGQHRYLIGNAAGGSTPYISFSRSNPIREGSKVRISSTTGLSGMDGDFYLGKRGASSFYLYTDVERTTVPTVTGTYAGGALARLLISEVATKLVSDRRISSSYTPDEWMPKYGIDSNGWNIYPLNVSCESMACDYMRKPDVFINCADTSIDLELTYTFRLLMRVKDEMVKMFFERMREPQSAQMAAADEQANP